MGDKIYMEKIVKARILSSLSVLFLTLYLVLAFTTYIINVYILVLAGISFLLGWVLVIATMFVIVSMERVEKKV